MDQRPKCKIYKIMKLLEEIIEKTLYKIGVGNYFFFQRKTPEAQATKTKLEKWDYIKLKTSSQQKKQQSKTDRKGKKTHQLFICQRLNNQAIQETQVDGLQIATNPVKKWTKDMSRHFSDKEMQMAKKQLKKCYLLPLGNANPSHKDISTPSRQNGCD